MRVFINKIVGGGIILLLLVSCSKEAPAPQTENLGVETVEEITPQAPLAPAEKPAQTAPVVSGSTSQKQTPVATNSVPTYTAQELMAQLKKWEQNLKTFSADFKQVSSYDGVEINRSQGKLYYDFSGGLLRWEVLTKEGETDQVGISNKKEIVILDETLKPVTTLSWQEWQQGQANQALFDIGNYAQLAAQHDVAVVRQDDQRAVLSFTPKNTKEKYILFITLSKKDFFPQEIAIEADDMLTTNQLISVRKNETLPTELFGGFFK